MEEIHFDTQDNCKLVKTRNHSVDYLLAYSKSLQIAEIEGVCHEMNLN